jgi:hypothetical protein
MNNLNSEIKSILELKHQGGDIKTNVQSVFAQADKTIKELFRSNKTIGDDIKNFMLALARFVIFRDEIEAVYCDLVTRIGQHIGQLILVITKDENFHHTYGGGFGYKPRDTDYFINENLYLAVIRDGALVVNHTRNGCEFPTDNYVKCLDTRNENIELVEKNLILLWDHDLGLSLNKPLECENPLFRSQGHLELDIKVGDEEVKAWFEEQNEHHHVIFQKATQLLDHLIVQSPELILELRRQREAVAEQLPELLKKRDQLKQRIPCIIESLRGGRWSLDDGSLIVRETEDDAPVFSVRQHEEFKDVETEIKRQLKVALELGMLNEPLIQQLRQEYKTL